MADRNAPSPAEMKEHARIMRELRQQGQAAMTWGLPNPATEVSILGMGLVIRDRLADETISNRAAKAAELAATMLEKSVQRMPQASSYQCERGCSYCCHSTVSVSAPEVFRIIATIDKRGAERPALEKSAVKTRAMARSASTVDAVLTLRDPCPLLVEGECSVYDDRPAGCRQFVSTSLAGCRSAFESRTDTLPFVPAAANAGVVVRSLLLSAAASLGLEAHTYDLSSALATALDQQDAEARWLAGEDVLAGAMQTPQPPRMREATQRWSGMLTGLFQ